MVISVSKKYLPFMGKGLEHPKLTLTVGDGFEFIKQHKGQFDVIITDSCDPVGKKNNIKYFKETQLKIIRFIK